MKVASIVILNTIFFIVLKCISIFLLFHFDDLVLILDSAVRMAKFCCALGRKLLYAWQRIAMRRAKFCHRQDRL